MDTGKFFSCWRKQGKAKTFELTVWAAEHPLALASAAGIAGVLLGAAALYVKRQEKKR